jgi:hypothetical protein
VAAARHWLSALNASARTACDADSRAGQGDRRGEVLAYFPCDLCVTLKLQAAGAANLVYADHLRRALVEALMPTHADLIAIAAVHASIRPHILDSCRLPL